MDATGTDGSDLYQAGTLRFGVSQDLRIYHGGTHNYITGITGDLVITTDCDGNGIILDAEDDTVEIKGSGTTQATFSTGGLCIVSGDAYSIAGSEVLSGSALASAVKLNNGNWCGTDLSVANGGTGASCLTDGGVLLGSGTSAITAMAVLADGEFIVGNGTTDPVAESGTTLRTSIGVGTGDSPPPDPDRVP